MPQKSKQKLKLLYLVDILSEKSDEDHALSAPELCKKLEEYGVSCERKSIYRDITVLQEYGMDIVKTRYPKRGFFLAERKFELPEVRLLLDAVQAAGFITQKKSHELIAKLQTLVSVEQAEVLQNQVYVDKRVKHTNEEIYYNIDEISKAISEKKKVSMQYFRIQIKEHMTARNVGKKLIISPYALMWSNDHYYLVGNNEKYDNLIHLRVDRMKTVETLREPIRPFSEVSEYSSVFDSADYAKKIFNMYGGDLQTIELKCKTSLIDSVVDRFGNDLPIRSSGGDWFVFQVEAMVSTGLMGWILQFGANIEVLSPLDLRRQTIEMVHDLRRLYKLR